VTHCFNMWRGSCVLERDEHHGYRLKSYIVLSCFLTISDFPCLYIEWSRAIP
jgi:hypothetical protein